MEEKLQRHENLKAPTAVNSPVPVASPPFLDRKNNNNCYFGEGEVPNLQYSESLLADHWVVAHGYTSPNEYEELLSILSTYGVIQCQKAGGNWLAVSFESRLSAEKAICCQPILLRNTLCGVARGTPNLLQSLRTEAQKRQNALTEEGEKTEQLWVGNKPSSGHLNEKDILRLENSSCERYHQAYQPKSICDKVLAWYFGWNEHPHAD